MSQQVYQPALEAPTLNLRDIHLPEPVSWWPPAPGWWLLAVAIVLFIIVFFIIRKIYRKTYLKRQLKRDIKAEFEHIKQHYQQTQNEVALAQALSVLLRRASISYYPAKNIAGLTGDEWLDWLDKTSTKSATKKFQSDVGKVLLSAPYMADNSHLNYDVQNLIQLCQSWLLSAHTKNRSAAS